MQPALNHTDKPCGTTDRRSTCQGTLKIRGRSRITAFTSSKQTNKKIRPSQVCLTAWIWAQLRYWKWYWGTQNLLCMSLGEAFWSPTEHTPGDVEHLGWRWTFLKRFFDISDILKYTHSALNALSATQLTSLVLALVLTIPPSKTCTCFTWHCLTSDFSWFLFLDWRFPYNADIQNKSQDLDQVN